MKLSRQAALLIAALQAMDARGSSESEVTSATRRMGGSGGSGSSTHWGRHGHRGHANANANAHPHGDGHKYQANATVDYQYEYRRPGGRNHEARNENVKITSPSASTVFHGGKKNVVKWEGGEGKWGINLMKGDDAFLITLEHEVEASKKSASVLIPANVGTDGNQYYLKFLPTSKSSKQKDVYSARFTLDRMTGPGSIILDTSNSTATNSTNSTAGMAPQTGPNGTSTALPTSVSADPTQLGAQALGPDSSPPAGSLGNDLTSSARAVRVRMDLKLNQLLQGALYFLVSVFLSHLLPQTFW